MESAIDFQVDDLNLPSRLIGRICLFVFPPGQALWRRNSRSAQALSPKFRRINEQGSTPEQDTFPCGKSNSMN